MTRMTELADADKSQLATPTILPPPTAPRDVAAVFTDTECVTRIGTSDWPTLVYWRGGWWQWRETHWSEVAGNVVEDWLYAFTERTVYKKNDELVPWAPTRRKIGDVLDALRGPLRLEDSVEAPAWLDGRGAGPIVSCANGLLVINRQKLLPHTPQYFNTSSVPFDYDPDAECPAFDAFVASLWDRDDETRRTLRQMMGYLVSGRTDMQCVFGLIGVRRGGKGTIARLVTALLGKQNVAPLTQADLGTQFGLEHVVGKSLAIISDARTAGKNTQTVVERLLSISGEDSVPVPRKYKSAWEGRLSARVMLMSNELPHLGDASTAVVHRFVMLPFSRSFAGNEDRKLEEKLNAELPGVLNVALEGLADLEREGRFAQSQAAQEMIEDAADLASPLQVFMREECDLAPNFQVSKDALYQYYRRWAERGGYAPLNNLTFIKALYAAGGNRISQMRGRAGDAREQMFKGIRLKPAAYGSARERAAAQSLGVLPGGQGSGPKNL